MPNTKFKHLRNGGYLYVGYLFKYDYEMHIHTIIQVKRDKLTENLILNLQNTKNASYKLPLFKDELDRSWIKTGSVLYATNKDDVLKEKGKCLARHNNLIRKLRK